MRISHSHNFSRKDGKRFWFTDGPYEFYCDTSSSGEWIGGHFVEGSEPQKQQMELIRKYNEAA